MVSAFEVSAIALLVVIDRRLGGVWALLSMEQVHYDKITCLIRRVGYTQKNCLNIHRIVYEIDCVPLQLKRQAISVDREKTPDHSLFCSKATFKFSTSTAITRPEMPLLHRTW